MKNHTKYKTKLLRALAAVSAGGFLLAQQAALLSVNVFAETIETPIYGENTKTLADITTMQEMTLGVCDRTPSYVDTSNYASKQLTDTRDGKTYWVAKLSDGRCWMTQNLDYDDPNSDRRTGDTKPDSWPNENTMRQYWDPGEKIISGSTLAAASSNTDKHLLVGNYYSWASATNGTGNNITSTTSSDYPIEASDSLCPNGWRLPTGRPTSGDFQLLVNQGKSGWLQYPGTNIPGYWLGGTSSTASGAAFFPAGGDVYSGSLSNAGSNGYYWSSTAQSATHAYGLYFSSGGVNPSNNNLRYVGFSVRCVNNPDTLDAKIPEIDNPNVTVTVPPVLTMTLTESVDINVKSNAISTGNFVAKVTSNAPYTISLSAIQNGHTDLQSAENGSIPASDDIKAGESGWGIKCMSSNCVNDSGTGILNTRYNALTEYGTPKIYFDSPSVAADQETSFEVGIGVDPSLASGTYATDVLVTAAQK